MILLVLQYFQSWDLHIPTVFAYTSTRMMLAAVTALTISILLGPTFIRQLYSWKMGQPIRKEECPLLGELHRDKENTPTMGGVLILVSMLLSMALWMDWQSVFTLILFVTTLVLGLMGGYDDYLKLKYKNTRGLKARKKLLFQAGLGLIIALYLLVPGIQEFLHTGEWYAPPTVRVQGQTIPIATMAKEMYVPFLKHPLVITGIGAALLMVFVVTGASNAVNLTDGLDGLAAGCLMMVAMTLVVFAFLSNHSDIAQYLNIPYIEGSGEIAVYLCAFIGASLGFLWYNGYPAQVFMGDIGSLTLGGILGVAAILLKRELLLGLVGGIFVVEALSVILQVASFRLRGGRRLFLCAPLHHHFEYKGWAETKVVIRFWIVGFLLAVVGLASLKFQ